MSHISWPEIEAGPLRPVAREGHGPLRPVNSPLVLPWHGEAFNVPFLEEAEVLQPIVDGINKAVADVEFCDPWVKQTFDVEGTGEGLVFYPQRKPLTRKFFSDLVFKAKGEKHKTVEKAKPAQLDPSVAASIDAFAEMVLTDGRLEQAARACASGALVYEKRLIGPFLAAICKDVEKETADELEESKLTWKQVQRAVSERARKWYIEKSEAL